MTSLDGGEEPSGRGEEKPRAMTSSWEGAGCVWWGAEKEYDVVVRRRRGVVEKE